MAFLLWTLLLPFSPWAAAQPEPAPSSQGISQGDEGRPSSGLEADPLPDVGDGALVVEETVEERVVKKKHDVVPANTLWDLAQHYYKDPWKWPVIYQANRDKIRDPHWIYPGQIFVIPGFDTMARVVRKGPAEPPPPVEEEPLLPEEPVEEEPEELPLPSLSVRLPEGMTGQSLGTPRERRPEGWSADGRVVPMGGRERLAVAGDYVAVRVRPDPGRGERFTVYRLGAPTELDEDRKAVYLHRVGLVEVVRKLSKGEYRAVVVKAGDAIQADDLLKRE